MKAGMPMIDVSLVFPLQMLLQGWDLLMVDCFVGTASRLGILSTSLQTLRPCCCACGTVRVEIRSQKLKRRDKLLLRKYLIFIVAYA